MKVAIQSFNLAPHELGGAERAARELAVGLKQRGHDVWFVLSDGSKPYPAKLDEMRIDIVEGVPIGKSPLWGNRSFLQRMLWILRSEADPVLFFRSVAYLRKHRPDIALMNNPARHGSSFMLAARILGVPCIPILRDYGWACAFGIMMRDGSNCERLCRQCRLTTAFRRANLRKASEVIAISRHMQGFATNLLELNNVRMIYDSLPGEIFREPPSLARPESHLSFGYLGRIHPAKGVVELLKGWSESGLGLRGHRLCIAGDLQEGFDHADLLHAAGVSYLGRVEPRAFLDKLDVLVVPALWSEPFGRTTIEGLARRCYVVAGPYGATSELLPEGCGEILSSVTAKTVAECLVRLCEDLPKRNLAEAFDRCETALNAFRSSRMIDEYHAALTRYAPRTSRKTSL